MNKDIPRYAAGLIGSVASLFLLASHPFEPKVVLASGFFAFACVTDTLSSRIPNALTVSLFAAGVVLNAWTEGPPGLLAALLGCAAGLGLLLLPYLMGGMGGGDVKTFGALGALLGAKPILQVFIYTALFGGALSLLHHLFARGLKGKSREWGVALRAFTATGQAACLTPTSSEKLRFPYAAAIAFGYFAHVQWGEAL
ncbi:MAG: prepilin peptidase [Deltaproteobacteria bacterium]|nr:prepilin peptidase [Deltaproteobacteria bacterium]